MTSVMSTGGVKARIFFASTSIDRDIRLDAQSRGIGQDRLVDPTDGVGEIQEPPLEVLRRHQGIHSVVEQPDPVKALGLLDGGEVHAVLRAELSRLLDGVLQRRDQRRLVLDRVSSPPPVPAP